MRKRTSTYIILLLSVMTACQDNDLPTKEGTPLSFSAQQTRTGLSSIFENFKVWGSCTTNGIDADIMQGYRVNYDATDGWTYSVGEGTESQTLQYWNDDASMYRFHAGAPAERVESMTESSLTLSMKATTTLSETSLYSRLCVVRRTDPAFGNVVNMDFAYANARINLAFRYLSDSPASITAIRLIPPSSYATAATLQIIYDRTTLNASPGTLTVTGQSSENLTFPDVEISANSGATVQTAVPRYMIPDPSATGKWKVNVTVGSETKEAEFTIGEPWEPGRSYVYRFEYTTEANLVFAGTATELFEGDDPEDGGVHNFN